MLLCDTIPFVRNTSPTQHANVAVFKEIIVSTTIWYANLQTFYSSKEILLFFEIALVCVVMRDKVQLFRSIISLLFYCSE